MAYLSVGQGPTQKHIVFAPRCHAFTNENPKSEARKMPRGPKQTQSQIELKTEKIQNANPKQSVWNIAFFEHLNLFRISKFCASSFLFSFLGALCVFARVI